ncbi:MAG: hypothetical protein AB7S36_04585, partial [Planctomycetota bacterium]
GLHGLRAFELGTFRPAEVLAHNPSFSEELLQRPGMLRLCCEPLMYSMVLEGYARANGHLPDTEAAVYESFVTDYLSARLANQADSTFGVSARKTLLSALARAMGLADTLARERAIDTLATALLQDPDLAPLRRELIPRDPNDRRRRLKIEGGAPSLDEYTRAEKLLDELVRGGLLLEGAGGRLRLIASGLQSYLQGIGLNDLAGIEFVRHYVQNPAWHPAVQAYCGLLDDPTAMVGLIAGWRPDYGADFANGGTVRLTVRPTELILAGQCLGQSRAVAPSLERWIVGGLVRYLVSPVGIIRHMAARSLAATGSPHAAVALADACRATAPDSADRAWLLEAWRELADPAALDELRQLLRTADADANADENRARIIAAIGAIPTSPARNTVWAIASNPHAAVSDRRAAGRVALSQRFPQAADTLAPWLTEEPEVWRPLAARLATPGDLRPVPALRLQLEVGSDDERRAAAFALALISPAAVADLKAEGDAAGWRVLALAMATGASERTLAAIDCDAPAGQRDVVLDALQRLELSAGQRAALGNRLLQRWTKAGAPDDGQPLDPLLRRLRHLLGDDADRALQSARDTLAPGPARQAVLRVLASTNDAAVQTLLSGMKDAALDEQRLSVAALGHSRNPAARAFIRQTAAEDGPLQLDALDAWVTQFDPGESLEPFARVLNGNRPDRWRAARALMTLNDAEAEQLVAAFVRSGHPLAWHAFDSLTGSDSAGYQFRIGWELEQALEELLVAESTGQRGLRVVSATSEQQRNPKEYLLQPGRSWFSGSVQFPQEVVLDLGTPRTVTQVVLGTENLPERFQTSAREVEILLATSAEGPWTSAGKGELRQNTPDQVVQVSTPMEASHVCVRIISNHGNTSTAALSSVQVRPPAAPIPPERLAGLLRVLGHNVDNTWQVDVARELTKWPSDLSPFLEHGDQIVRDAASDARDQIITVRDRRTP